MISPPIVVQAAAAAVVVAQAAAPVDPVACPRERAALLAELDEVRGAGSITDAE
ncbi:hypothetical protein GCM10009760_36110 [Kitasatospora kazusensis]|uniref:SHOCT domain-containing protein n=1 Tax=Kitasatospora kazusensis TaxID=407974 RepID=A0ABP5LJW5_9ACTN